MSDRDQQAETARAQLLSDLLKHSTAEQNRLSQEAQSRERDGQDKDHERSLAEIDRAVSIHGAERDRQVQDSQHNRQLQHDMAKHRLTVEAQQRLAAQKAAQRPTDA
jgi:predicted transcriptional regulator